jgi:hypothetical protein
MNTSLRAIPLGTIVMDNFSPTNRSVLFKHGRKFAYLRNPAGGIRRVSYSQLDIMLYGV